VGPIQYIADHPSDRSAVFEARTLQRAACPKLAAYKQAAIHGHTLRKILHLPYLLQLSVPARCSPKTPFLAPLLNWNHAGALAFDPATDVPEATEQPGEGQRQGSALIDVWPRHRLSNSSAHGGLQNSNVVVVALFEILQPNSPPRSGLLANVTNLQFQNTSPCYREHWKETCPNASLVSFVSALLAFLLACPASAPPSRPAHRPRHLLQTPERLAWSSLRSTAPTVVTASTTASDSASSQGPTGFAHLFEHMMFQGSETWQGGSSSWSSRTWHPDGSTRFDFRIT